MSKFSYISFPRVPDISMLKSNFDPSKSFTVKEVRGTELKQQFQGNLNNFPKEADDLNLYFGDFFNDILGISVYDIENISFHKVFENEHIYGFSGSLKKPKNKNDIIGVGNKTANDSFINSFIECINKDYTICRNQLNLLANTNLLPGESIEIYSEYVHGLLSDLGPFRKEIAITSDQIITTKCFDGELDRVKIVIHKV